MEFTCEYCGRVKERRSKNQRYCTYKCKRAGRLAEKKEIMVTSVCKRCGKQFQMPMSSRSRTCGDIACRKGGYPKERKPPVFIPRNVDAYTFANMETMVVGIPSWECPEMLPLEWVDLPVAVRFNVQGVSEVAA